MKMKRRRFITGMIMFGLISSSLAPLSVNAAEPEDECMEVSSEEISGSETEPTVDAPFGEAGDFNSENGKEMEGTRGPGWVHDSNGWRYYITDTVYATGWKKIGDYWYYFNPSTGYMHTGWLSYNGHWYFFETNTNSSHYGQMATGWRRITVSGSQDWYYFDTDGIMLTGWQFLTDNGEDNWYYFASDGKMKTGWFSYNNHWYFFQSNGIMVTGWHNVQGYTYYFNSNGQYRETTRRAIVIGDDYNERGMDMDGWENCFSNLSFQGEEVDRIELGSNLSSVGFYDLIEDVMSDATESDVTYISITCHGSSTGQIRISPTFNISGQTLRNTLDQYNGKVVLFLNCCFAGTIIHGTDSDYPEMDFLSAFTDETDSGELLDDKYIVLCSAAYDEYSYKYHYQNTSYWIAYANEYWTKGGGWNLLTNISMSMQADSNSNSIVTMDELYSYSYAQISGQHIVTNPANCEFTIFARN